MLKPRVLADLTKCLLTFVLTLCFCAVINRFLEFFLFSAILSILLSLFTLLLYSWIDARMQINTVSVFERFWNNLLVFTVACLSASLFLLTIPINVDRSFSVWLLSELKVQEDPIELSKAQVMFTQYFGVDSGEILRRIEEQKSLGNIDLKPNNTLQISQRGKLQVYINYVIRNFFALNDKYARYR